MTWGEFIVVVCFWIAIANILLWPPVIFHKLCKIEERIASLEADLFEDDPDDPERAREASPNSPSNVIAMGRAA